MVRTDTAALGKTRQTQIPTSSNSAETEIAQLKQLRLFKIAKAEYIPDFIVWRKLFQKSKVNITLDIGPLKISTLKNRLPRW